jgi:glutaredoxin
METENEKQTAGEVAETKTSEATETKTSETTETKTSASDLIAKSKEYGKKCSEACRKNMQTIVVIIAAVVIVGGAFAYKMYQKKYDIGPVAAKEAVQKYVDEAAPATVKVEIKDAVKEGDLYKVNLDINGQEVSFYVTRDGKRLFQGVIELDTQKNDEKNKPQQQAAVEKSESEKKLDIPEVDLFIMSFCPYGTQIEKGILPVVDLLGSKIKFNLKFVDYAMHGDKEITENLRQYCIQKTQPTKLSAYLKCFLKKGEGTADACLKTAGVNSTQVGTCFSETDKRLSIKVNAADKSKWSNGTYPPFDVNKEDVNKYGVQGSPTLVINGTNVSVGRDSASILKAVCSGFTNQPKECSQTLSSATPAPGFGEGAVEGASTEANCGS